MGKSNGELDSKMLVYPRKECPCNKISLLLKLALNNIKTIFSQYVYVQVTGHFPTQSSIIRIRHYLHPRRSGESVHNSTGHIFSFQILYTHQ